MSICQSVKMPTRGRWYLRNPIPRKQCGGHLIEENADLMRTSPLQRFMWTRTRQSCYKQPLLRYRVVHQWHPVVNMRILFDSGSLEKLHLSERARAKLNLLPKRKEKLLIKTFGQENEQLKRM